MFEVGKSYKHRVSDRIIKAVFVYRNGAQCVSITTDLGSASLLKVGEERVESHYDWEEYREPVVEVGEFYLTRGVNVLNPTRCEPLNSLGKFRLTVTDGVLTDAKVING